MSQIVTAIAVIGIAFIYFVLKNYLSVVVPIAVIALIIAGCVAIAKNRRQKSTYNYRVVETQIEQKTKTPKQQSETHSLQSSSPTTNINSKGSIQGGYDMPVRLGAGKYVFGENIPLGTYNLKVISGEGTLTMQKLKGTEWKEDWFDFGKDEGYTKSYHGLTLPEGKWFEVGGDVVFEISKAKMIDID